MTIETLRENPTHQIESFANSLPDQAEKDLILAFLQNPIIAGKIEQSPDYFRQASPQDKLIISGDAAGWAFEWLAFIHLQQHTKHTLFSPQDVSNLYQQLHPTRQSTDFFFQGKLLVNTTVPDMMEVRNATKTLQITRIVEAKSGQFDRGAFTFRTLYHNLFRNLGLQNSGSWQSLGKALHMVRPDLEEKPAHLSPKFKFTFAVPSNFSSSQSKYPLERIPISTFTLHRLVQTITSDSI